MDSLFDFAIDANKPLADRMRPQRLSDFIGQEQAVGPNSPLRRMMERDQLQSILFYGPPGTGKTTLARVIANRTHNHYVAINAVASGIPELRKLIAQAESTKQSGLGRTLVFIDEIHRFNKAQQDVLLPYVENGTIILIGATTENPFFEINSPLLSRMKIIRLEKLTSKQMEQVLLHAIADPERGYGGRFTISSAALRILADFAQGDARAALNLLEQAEFMLPQADGEVDETLLQSILGKAMQRYDKQGDQHYDIVSAFIKSMRGSDVNASLHYLARMIEGGEELRFIARRIVICAAEDVGLADPQALVVANAAAQAADFVGWPEARIPLAEAVCYIAKAPKSNAAYMGIDAALADVRRGNVGTVPAHLRDAHYPGASALGHGREYKYPHAYGGWVEQQYLPDNLVNKIYYQESNNGNDIK